MTYTMGTEREQLMRSSMDLVSANLYRKDYGTIVLALRELAQQKHEQLVQKNASDLEWNEVDNLYRIASNIEIEVKEVFQ